jgi:hypothetical protein
MNRGFRRWINRGYRGWARIRVLASPVVPGPKACSSNMATLPEGEGVRPTRGHRHSIASTRPNIRTPANLPCSTKRRSASLALWERAGVREPACSPSPSRAPCSCTRRTLTRPPGTLSQGARDPHPPSGHPLPGGEGPCRLSGQFISRLAVRYLRRGRSVRGAGCHGYR